MPSLKRPDPNKAAAPKPKAKRKPKPRPPKLTGLPLGHPGRPPVYDPALNPRVTKLALLGQTDEEIAHFIGIDPDTLRLWKTKHPDFYGALEAGRVDADAEMAASLYNRGRGMKLPAVKIFYDKDKGEPVYVPYVEHLPPDVGAAKLWLTNRRPKEWRERREVEVTGTLEHRLAQMTPEERRARLLELQARAAITIEGEATEAEE